MPHDELDTYEAAAYCRNCAYEGLVTARVGEPIYMAACPVCGVLQLSSVAQRDWDQDRVHDA